MASPLPHSRVIAGELRTYATDATTLVASSIMSVARESAFTSIYKTTLAAHAVIEKLRGAELPSYLHASSILQRIPLLILMSQSQAAEVELRRVIELMFQTFYFSDHPVEWDMLVRQPQRSIQHERDNPIAGNAYREPSYYRLYAKERFAAEPSGIAAKSIDRLGVEYGNLSSAAHAPAATDSRAIRPVVENLSGYVLGRFSSRFKMICADVCAVASAFSPTQFDALQPVYRAWYDWLLGPEIAKKVRSGKFGLPQLRTS